MVADESTDDLIRWSDDGDSFFGAPPQPSSTPTNLILMSIAPTHK